MKVFLILAAVTLLVRLPFFFPDVIDPDESTYILMGQDVVDGNLPYVKLWAFMPPLSIYCFATMIITFGKTIPGIRLGGALFMLLAAWFVYLSGEKLKNSRTGLIAALLLILYSTISLSGGGTTSETLAIAPLTGALLLLLKEKFRTRDFFFAGLLVSCACLIRLNLIYLAMLSVPFVLCGRLIRTNTSTLKSAAAYAAGGIAPVAFFFLPYLSTGNSELFITTLYRAPLSYSVSQLGTSQAVFTYLGRFIDFKYLSQNVFLAGFFLCGLAYAALSWRNFSEAIRSRLPIILFFLAATGLSILRTGQAYEHYLVQVFPFIALIAALFLDFLLSFRAGIVIALASSTLLIFPAWAVVDAYRPVAPRAMAGERLTYGPAYELHEFLKNENPDNAPVYFMAGHIVHWFQNTKPIAAITTHPSNIGREYLVKAFHGPSATVESELAEILAKEPAFIVKPVNVRYLKPHPAALELLAGKLFTDYELVRIIDDLMIYRHL